MATMNDKYLQTDKYYILDSKSVLMDDCLSSLIVPIVYNDKVEGIVKIAFRDEEKEKGGIKKSIEDGVLVLTCINLDSPFGNYSIEPVSIGILNEKEIKMSIWSSLSREGVRIVQYTVYMEK